MGAHEFGQLVDRAIRDRGLSQARVGVLVGELPDGRILNEKAVERVREGGRRLDRMLVQRLIEALELDPAEAWAAAGLWPPDLELSEYRRLREAGRPAEPALTRVGGGDTPPASSLRKAPTPLRTEGRRRGNSCYGRSYRIHAGQRHRRLLEPAHIGQRVAA
jgi:hypothetical protein